jgi:hypothetical protein
MEKKGVQPWNSVSEAPLGWGTQIVQNAPYRADTTLIPMIEKVDQPPTFVIPDS